MQSDKAVSRRSVILWVPPFFLALLKLVGCGGGGGNTAAPSAAPPISPPAPPISPPQEQFVFPITIEGTTANINMATAAPTVLELTQQAAASVVTVTKGGYNGIFVRSINRRDGYYDGTGPFWVFEINRARIEGSTVAADIVRLNRNDHLEWKLI